jgi:hypothetical protein
MFSCAPRTKNSARNGSAQKNHHLDRNGAYTGKESLVISKKIVAVCATVGVAFTGFALGSPAQAEPVSNDYAIVGSDTLEDVLNGLVNGSNLTGSSVRVYADGATMGSFDATGSPFIVTKPNGVRFGRPNGSSDGVTALRRSITGAAYTSGTAGGPASVVISGMVDIARSSSGPGTNANAAGLLAYVPFGRDAIAYAYDSRTAAGSDTTAISTLTKAQLKSIFECTLGTVAAPIGGTGGLVVKPVIPQSGSGTRKDFLKMIGVDSTGNGNLGSDSSCITVGQEHDGTSLTGAGYLMPMSVSRWVAMNTGATFSRIGNAVIAGVADVSGAPVTGTGSSMVPNQTYYNDGTFGRDTYLVVEYARIDATAGNLAYDTKLAAVLNPTTSKSLTNTGTLASSGGALKKKYGFLAPSSTTIQRAYGTL